MTQKEKLYFEYLKIQNSIYAVMGETDKQINLDEFSETGRFFVEAKNHKVYELEEMIKNATTRLERAKKEARREAWFTTPEGAQWKREMVAQIKQVYDSELALLDSARKHTSKVVQQLLGAHFDVTNFGSSNMTIGLVEEYKEEYIKPYFGHTFDVYFDGSWGKENNRWELNYGCLGSFDLNEQNNTRTQYLVGLAKFSANQTAVPALRDYLHDFVRQLHELSSKRWKLEHEIENPSPLANK